jgi:signal transduction histidine kinase
MTYFAACAAASGVFLVAGRRSRHVPGFSSARAGSGLSDDPLWDGGETNRSELRPQADAGAALRLAVKRLAPVMANRSVQADIAASFGLMVRMRGAALADLLEEMLTAAIHAAPLSHILLTAARHAGSIAISVTDDIPHADPEVRKARVRSLKERVVLGGGSLNVEVRPEEGTTVTLWLRSTDEEARRVPEPEFSATLPFGR